MEDIFDLGNEDESEVVNTVFVAPAPQSFDNIAALMQAAKPATPWLDMLNAEQKRGATTGGPVLVLSGAGTGDKVLLLDWLIFCRKLGKALGMLGGDFTNRAAKEMGERVRDLIGMLPPRYGSALFIVYV